ncbi:hypothetical protein CBR_g1157 [Chara braunii]|uniref:DUF4360 domain-containing protein n=1 Tax=Chara braunii TaxID=69332 RepID=A0A388KDD7_CHABU|nr:hypothetical protein CBR_g1157 [Chara braunii]|eukprot:GBG68037.1 hypothetical protein CBR_g1157 [Chara braunii]
MKLVEGECRKRSRAMARQVVLAAVLLMITAVQASAQTPTEVTIGYVTYAGNGCNYDNNYVLSNDYKTITFIFDGMVATTDGSLANKREHCQMSFSMNYPDGWSVSIGQATGRGLADIAKNSEGIYETHYYFSRQTGTAMVERKMKVPKVGSFEFTEDFLTLVWSECNNAPNLNIKTVVRLEGTKAMMALDSEDTQFQLIYNLQWRQCPEN